MSSLENTIYALTNIVKEYRFHTIEDYQSIQAELVRAKDVFYETDITLVERLAKLYQQEKAQHSTQKKLDIWQEYIVPEFKALFFTLERNHINTSLAKFNNLHINELSKGFVSFPSEISKVFDKYDNFKRQYTLFHMDALVSFAEYLGIIPMEAIEQDVWGKALAQDPNYYVKLIERKLGFNISFPAFQNGLPVIETYRGGFTNRHFIYLYLALKIKDFCKKNAIENPKICEIGGGLGYLAYYLDLVGIKDITFIDIPSTSIVCSYFLMKNMPHRSFILNNEEQCDPNAIKLYFDTKFKKFEENSFDIVINCDSFPEINKEIILDYLEQIWKTSTYFYSINQEAQGKMWFSDAKQNHIHALLSQYKKEPLSRNLFWLRRGYTEEFYLCGHTQKGETFVGNISSDNEATAKPNSEEDALSFAANTDDNTTVQNVSTMLETYNTPLPKPSAQQQSATYFVEICSECNLKCSLCAFNHRNIFDHKRGMMSMEKFIQILDKIQRESPGAMVSPYHYCEPSLHPQLPEMVKEIKKRGFTCNISMNFNHIKRLKDLLKAKPDLLEISASGFYQETYKKAHIGGNIEKVKENLILLREAMNALHIFPFVRVTYHMYKDNIDEDFDKMRDFAHSLGFAFFPCWSRSINTELSLKYLREKGDSRYTGETYEWFDNLAPLNDTFIQTMEERMLHLPQDYLQNKWKDITIDECPCKNRLVNIRWTGEVNLCSWTFDDRNVVGNYLEMDLQSLYEARKDNLICKECLANNYALYTNYFDMKEIDALAIKKLGRPLPEDRCLCGVDIFRKAPIQQQAPAPSQIYPSVLIELVGACNAKCKYCVTGSRNHKMSNKFMSPELFEKTLLHLMDIQAVPRHERSTIPVYNWGEPFIHPQLDGILEVAAKYNKQVSISTNFIAFPKVKIENYKHISNVVFSTCTLTDAQTYKRIYGADLSKTLENLKNFIILKNKFAPSLSIHINFLKYNFNKSDEAYVEQFLQEHNMTHSRTNYNAFLNDGYAFRKYLSTGELHGYDETQMLEDLNFDLIKNVIKKCKPENYHCPQLNSIIINEKAERLLCCVLTNQEQKALTLGSIFDMTMEDTQRIVTQQVQPVSICKECLASGQAWYCQEGCSILE